MKRICGLMLFCFGLGMAVLLFIPETIFTFFFVVCCLVLGIICFAADFWKLQNRYHQIDDPDRKKLLTITVRSFCSAFN